MSLVSEVLDVGGRSEGGRYKTKRLHPRELIKFILEPRFPPIHHHHRVDRRAN